MVSSQTNALEEPLSPAYRLVLKDLVGSLEVRILEEGVKGEGGGLLTTFSATYKGWIKRKRQL